MEVKLASDFIGSAVGESQTKTTTILASCTGKVLVIDEAYGLNDGQYGKQALDTLVGLVDPKPGADMAVLMVGYEQQMRQMFRDQNPGLSRRFDFANALGK